mgnify:CR=1 FL=1
MWKSGLLIVTMIAITPMAGAAVAATPAERLDRIEDRIDRRESRIDERVDLGPRDVIEDRIDRRESLRDRRGIEGSLRVDRHERRSWWRLLGSHQSE